MEIKIAEYCGFCYGVKRAVEMAEKAAADRVNGATLGPLIHNPQFIAELEAKGIACKDDLDQFTAGETVIFRSHGVGPEVYEKAEAKQLNIIDATCPNVRMAQKKAFQAAQDGYLPIIVGEKNHPEVKSIKKWAGENAIVVEYLKDISEVPQKDKYAVIIQTTFELQKFEEILAALQKEREGEYRVERTICLATSQRQNAAMKLAGEVDAFIVIGGRNSANTRHLYELVANKCPKAYHIETAAELEQEMFRDCIKIGITAGASTPDRLIKEAIVAMENMDFESLLAQSEEVNVYPGKIVEATVIQLDKDGVYVDFGYMREGIVTYPEWSLTETAEELMATIKVGDKVEVKVIPGTSKDDFVRMSKIKAERDAAWKNVAELAEGEKRAATVKVIRIIKNKAKNIVGLAVAVEGVEGFMPASHVELKRVEDFTGYVGQELEAEIIEVDLEKKRIVVSRRDLLKAEKEAKAKAWKEAKEARIAAAKEARAAAEEAAYASVEEGTTVPGKVVKIAEFGLFVEVGAGLVGLVHNTELSWNRNAKAEDVAAVGDEVEVFIKKIDRENKRVALSIKATQEDPWKVEAGKLNIGDIVEVQVLRFLPFGAIVKISDKVEGLVHISEIAEERIAKADDVLEAGQIVKAQVLKMDLEGKKIGLSIVKAAQAAEQAEYSSYLNGSAGLTQDLSEQLQ
ncbi:MAG: 4-hydroxy-3-methylbut-2-enyl diphosphate reductase [Phascolarctobacterium sp.]|nr:4-hydroxy-3-methylbut-2-enyl diphosphate reductase [Phascolarctobacterium sp.]MBR6679431.1 4-hydroxy-3-methylbut-2-enyl diphosphate reductase [Phascolarctobacterium sp.]